MYVKELKMRGLIVVMAGALLAVGCGGRDVTFVECETNSNCNLEPGGLCTLNPATNKRWCTYADDSCDSGRRWSDLDVGDGLSGTCVGQVDAGMADAAVDAPVADAGADAMPGADAAISCQERISFTETYKTCPIQGCAYTLYTIGPDGTNREEEFFNDSKIVATSWSADGARIAVVEHSLSTDERFLRIVTADGSGAFTTPVSGTSSFSPQQVDWSPDGSRIAYTVENTAVGYELYLMNQDGSNKTPIRSTSGTFGKIEWSPLANKIVYEHTPAGGTSSIEVVDGDGSNHAVVVGDTAHNVDPHWTSDGLRVVFRTDRDGNDEVYVVNLDGSAASNLTQTTADDNMLSASPTEARIVFRENNALRRKMIGTSGSLLLVGGGLDPAWSSDGERLVYTVITDGRDLWRIDKDAANATQLTNMPGQVVWQMEWTPCR